VRGPAGHLLALALAALVGCRAQTAPARAQWKVYLATDAPVPQLGEQLFVELLESSGAEVAAGETRLIDGSRPELWPVSFGVVPTTPGAAVRLRARLYRLDETGADGTPQGTALIDATGTLPSLGPGVNEVAMTLAMACFGVASNLPGQRTCDPATGGLAPEPTLAALASSAPLPAPGSWPPALVVPCSSHPPAGMTCIPGGAFLLGATQYFSDGTDVAPSPQHLVQLRPFAIDTDEVTVGVVRELVQTMGLAPPLTGDTDPTAEPPECTYDNTSNTDAPVNCVSWTQANQACKLLGKQLPSEAQWEYVAGNLGQKTPFPWGTDTDVCARAVVARGRALVTSDDEALECLSGQSGFMPGPVSGGSSTDVSLLGVRNLGGNVSEWVADIFDPYTGPCWADGSLLVDPVCSSAVAKSTVRSIRGGSWQTGAVYAYATQRQFAPSSTNPPGVSIGLRCVVDM
jgi:formylglycine-generating enzyme required for sulfatase activity